MEAAFDYVSNIDNRPEWQDILNSVERDTPFPDRKGASWKDNFMIMGIHQSASMSYIEFNHPKSFVETIKTPTSKGRIAIVFNKENNGCSITITSDLEWKGIFKLFSPLMEHVLKTGIQQDLINIKHILESAQLNTLSK